MHNLTISNGHYIIEINNGNYLIDTGSPISLGNGIIDINNQQFNLRNDTFQFIEKANQANLFDGDIVGIIGLDILQGKIVTISKIDNKVYFDRLGIDLQRKITFSIGLGGAILCDVETNNLSCKAVFDSGAFISYASPRMIGSSTVIANIHDYNPMLGDINTTKHSIDINIGNTSFTTEVAKMTPVLEMSLNMINVEYVLGLDAIPSDVIEIDLINNTILF